MGKDFSEMSNSEIKLYQKTLENEYETIKKEIGDKLKKLDEMDVEYNKATAELNKRKTRFN